jgi:YesN/AraC family two-component response regulator
VITDIIMPGLTGLALAEELRRLRPEIRVLYMSGYTDKALIDTSMLGPREAFIGKPFTPMALSGKLRELLDRTV